MVPRGWYQEGFTKRVYQWLPYEANQSRLSCDVSEPCSWLSLPLLPVPTAFIYHPLPNGILYVHVRIYCLYIYLCKYVFIKKEIGKGFSLPPPPPTLLPRLNPFMGCSDFTMRCEPAPRSGKIQQKSQLVLVNEEKEKPREMERRWGGGGGAFFQDYILIMIQLLRHKTYFIELQTNLTYSTLVCRFHT